MMNQQEIENLTLEDAIDKRNDLAPTVMNELFERENIVRKSSFYAQTGLE